MPLLLFLQAHNQRYLHLLLYIPQLLPTLEQLVKHITRIKKHINYELDIEGILITLVDSRTNFSKEIIKLIRNFYGHRVKVFTEFIPRSVRAEECTAEGVSIFDYEPEGIVAMAYQSLAEEVLANE